MSYSKTHDFDGNPLACEFPGCDGFMAKKGLCETHYQQQRNGGELQPITRTRRPAFCKADLCNRSANHTGYCVGHSRQIERGEEPHPLLVGKHPSRVCAFPDCGRPRRNSGLCDSHQAQVRRGKELTPILVRGESIPCGVARCGRDMNPLYKMCGRHRTRHYGLDMDTAFELFSRDHCDACGDPLRQGMVDHDHSCCPGEGSCGKCVRGILCTHCNKLLGCAKDDPIRLEQGINYLLRSKIQSLDLAA